MVKSVALVASVYDFTMLAKVLGLDKGAPKVSVDWSCRLGKAQTHCTASCLHIVSDCSSRGLTSCTWLAHLLCACVCCLGCCTWDPRYTQANAMLSVMYASTWTLSECTLPRPGMLVEEVVENVKIVVSTGQGSTGLISIDQ